MNAYQKQISSVVKDYIDENPQEFDLFRRAMRQQQENAITDFAEVKGESAMERKMYEVPETLHAKFNIRLDDDSFKYLLSIKGSRWFAKNFPAFRAGKRV